MNRILTNRTLGVLAVVVSSFLLGQSTERRADLYDLQLLSDRIAHLEALTSQDPKRELTAEAFVLVDAEGNRMGHFAISKGGSELSLQGSSPRIKLLDHESNEVSLSTGALALLNDRQEHSVFRADGVIVGGKDYSARLRSHSLDIMPKRVVVDPFAPDAIRLGSVHLFADRKGCSLILDNNPVAKIELRNVPDFPTGGVEGDVFTSELLFRGETPTPVVWLRGRSKDIRTGHPDTGGTISVCRPDGSGMRVFASGE